MNKWIIVFLALLLSGIAYSFWRTWNILPFANVYKWITLAVIAMFVILFFANFTFFHIEKWSMGAATAAYEIGNSTIFILLYTIILYLLLDLGRLVHLVPRSFMFDSWKGTITVVALLVGVFTYGYFHYMDKKRMPLPMKTSKSIGHDRKIVMLSDLHLGYHNRRGELARWVDMVNAENPELVLIGGDIIDRYMRPLNDEKMAEEFRRIKAPVVACLGNHEFYSGVPEAVEFYREAGITLLRDSAITLNGINIIGRDDRTNPRRKSVKQLTEGLDMSLYTIMLDHQPYNLEDAEQAGIDFQLSGHTHYGQVWPISWIEDAIYEDAYGGLMKGNTQYYVTSGIGIWGGKFRIGTQSEYVVGTISASR